MKEKPPIVEGALICQALYNSDIIPEIITKGNHRIAAGIITALVSASVVW